MWNDFSSEKHDRALNFRHRVNEATLAALGLPAPKNKRRAIARAAILAEVLLGYHEGRAVSFSRRPQFYVSRSRYLGLGGTYANIMGEVEILCSAGLVDEVRAKPGSRGIQSTLGATLRLTEKFKSIPSGEKLSFHLSEPIILRDKLGDGRVELLNYSETPETVKMRRQIAEINSAYRGVILDLPSVPKTELHWIVGGSLIVPTPLYLYRVFNRGSFRCGGRAFAFWQQLPKDMRMLLCLSGEAVAEPDYSAIHAALIYAERSLPLSGDPYDLDGFEREEGKLAFLVAINAGSKWKAIGALVKRHGMKPARAVKILRELESKHRAIWDCFCSDAGVYLMRTDSDLILAVTSRCLKSGIPALPVHDSVIAPVNYEQLAAAIMAEEFENRYPKATPCKIKTKAKNVSHIPTGLPVPPLSPPGLSFLSGCAF
jgi:hypothetical protein